MFDTQRGSGETVLAHLPEVGKGSGNPAPKLADRWKSGVWLGKSDLTDEHLVRTDDGVVYARSVRRLAAGQKRTSRQSSRPHRSRGRSQQMMHQIPEWYQKHMEGETLPEPDTAVMSSSSRGEKRTETQENVFVKRLLMAKSPKRPITLVPPPEDSVKR